MRKIKLFEDLIKDTGYALRLLRRSPGFSILAILCLTVGIGATTAVFSWMEGILLRPFPLVASQERLAAITGRDRKGDVDDISWPDFIDLRKNCTLVEAFIADRIFGTTLSIGARAEHATGSVVSANYFAALGIRPILGRAFEPSDETGRNAHPVTVISYEAWKDRYRGDFNIVGKTQLLNGVPHTIIGVAPPGFYGTFVGYSFQFWVPASMEELFEAGGYKLENRGARWIEGFVLLKPGVTLAQAQAEMSAVAKRLEINYPATNRGRGIKLYPLWQTPFNGAGTLFPTLEISLVVACFVLLIACANVGNLLLFRSFGRRHEMTVRLSLGAGRSRLMKQLLTEGFILAALAACGGLAVAYWCRNLIMLLFPRYPGIIVNLPAEIDWRVLALSAGVCLISTLLFGLVPATQASNVDLTTAMKSDSGGALGGRGKAGVRSTLVLVQVSLSFVLLIAAGLLLKSVRAMGDADPGFSADRVLTTGVDMIAAGYDPPRIKSFEDRMLDRIQAMPGVESAVFARVAPISYKSYSAAPIVVERYETQPGEQPTVEYDEVGPAFLATMGIPLMSGREFTRADNETARLVAVVNEAMARQFWRGKDPVGKRFQAKDRWLQVVGVARNSRYQNLLENSKPFFYVPMRQSIMGQGLEIRTALPPGVIGRALAREVKALDRNLAPFEVITMREQIYRMSWSKRAAVTLLIIFGGIALLLAGIGLYGVMSYSVSQSTRELGLRIALGADTFDLMRLVMSHGFALTAAGMALGGAAALGLTRLLGYLLYKVSPRDPLTFGAVLVVMTVVSLVACSVPAWRAMRTDPVRALRS
ncbi:MAG TPA: ABC transporter permease [Bryobacteraceae bacterium]|jgi:predicted permease|nr:ABC transporter permease [Bryobacteraceae bacterium]